MQAVDIKRINFFVQNFTGGKSIRHSSRIKSSIDAIAYISQKLLLLIIQRLINRRTFCILVGENSHTQEQFIFKINFIIYIQIAVKIIPVSIFKFHLYPFIFCYHPFGSER